MSELLIKKSDDEEVYAIKNAGIRLANQIEDIQDYTECKRNKVILEEEDYMCTSLMSDVVTNFRLSDNKKDLELIVDQNEDEVETDTKQIKKPKNILKQSVVENAIIEIITENDNKGRQSGLGEIGSRLQKKYSDFDVRNYGYSSLSKFLEEIEGFDVININNTVIVRLREDLSVRKHVTDFAIKSIEDTNGTGMELGAL
jgi:hypothetical protein